MSKNKLNKKELGETLIAVGQTPDMFHRDTPLLFQILDNFEAENRRLIKRIENVSLFKKQAE